MNVRGVTAAGAMALALSACSGISVTHDYDPSVNFANYQTFVVLDAATGGEDLPSFLKQRVKTSIARNLAAKGLREVSSLDDADMAVGWQVTTDERSSFNTVSTGWGGYPYGWGYGGWYGGGYGGMGMATTTTTETRYTVGALVIAMFSVEQEEMIFTATGSKELAGDNPSPEESQQRIDDAVQKILESFPPSGSDS